MKYLESNGTVYRMTDDQYRAFLQSVADGHDPAPAKFGKFVCELDQKDAEDMERGEARMYLDDGKLS